MSTASAMQASSIIRVGKSTMVGMLHREPEFAELFIAYLLSRNVRIEEDLVDQLFNSSEKRLARILLLLAHFGKEPRPETVIPKVSQETLAAMVGTTRSRVSYFMNRFRKLGFIHYNGGLQVHSAPAHGRASRLNSLPPCLAQTLPSSHLASLDTLTRSLPLAPSLP